MFLTFASHALGQLPTDTGSLVREDARRSKWAITPSLKLVETYTDNVFLSPRGSQQSDWISQFVPGISATANGPRLRVAGFYAPEIVYHSQAQREDKVFHRGNAFGTLELAEELLFVDAGAKADQYDVSLQGPVTTSNVNITGNRATATTAYVSPYLVRQIGTAARAEARFTYSTWQSDNQRTPLPDNTARRVHLGLANGPAYRLLTWDVGYTKESIDYKTAQETTSENLTASGRQRITRGISLLALAGYERYDTGSALLAKPRWSTGFGWTPTPRTGLDVTAGRRLNNKAYGLDFSHRTRLTTWNASYAEDVTTSREQFFLPATQSTAGTLDQMFLSQYPDPVARQKAVQELISRMGLASNIDSPSNFFSDALFLRKRWLLSVGLHGVRNTLVASGFRELRELVAETGSALGDFAASKSIRTSGGSFAWGLRLTARNTWNVQAGYSHSEFLDGGQSNNFVSLQTGLSRQLEQRVSGSLSYRLQDRKFSQGGAPYRENAIIASLLMRF